MTKENKCEICGKNMGKYSAAISSHMRKHVRDGSVKEEKDKNGKLKWIPTGKEPKEKTKSSVGVGIRSKHNYPRTKVCAKSNKKGDLKIKCRKCNKWSNKKPYEFADNRFICIDCCDTISPFPKRKTQKILENPGEEYCE
jgi:hypothetical protein